jgi:hypothetical protein
VLYSISLKDWQQLPEAVQQPATAYARAASSEPEATGTPRRVMDRLERKIDEVRCSYTRSLMWLIDRQCLADG